MTGMLPEDKKTPELRALEAEIKADRNIFCYYARPWVKPTLNCEGKPILDVAIIGAGQNGLGCAYSLRSEGVERIHIFDRNPPYGNGNFAQYTRMQYLRTPKELCGLERGDPRLSFQRYYRACYGDEAWDSLIQAPRAAWADYLHWYSEVLELPLTYEHELKHIEPPEEEGGIFLLHFQTPEGTRVVEARTVVLACGSAADHFPQIPSTIAMNASKERWNHGSERIDFDALSGKHLAILGHGAGAFDLAGCSFDAGAAEVDIYYRRPKLPLVNPRRHLENAGMMGGFSQLPPEDRWRVLKHLDDIDQPPPPRAFDRIVNQPGLSVHPGVTWTAVEDEGDGLRITTTEGSIHVDHALLATGFVRKPMERREIQGFVEKIRTWENYDPPTGLESPNLSAFPDIGPGFEYQPKDEAGHGWLRSIFCVTFGSGLNLGSHLVSISGLQFTIPRLSAGVRNRLFTIDAEHYVETALAYNESELKVPAEQLERFNAG